MLSLIAFVLFAVVAFVAIPVALLFAKKSTGVKVAITAGISLAILVILYLLMSNFSGRLGGC
jgi:hypothetical protein